VKTFRQSLRFLVIGGLIGAVLGSIIAPSIGRMLHVRAAAMCDCTELADKIITTFWAMQGGGLVVGAICGMALWVILRRKGKLTSPI